MIQIAYFSSTPSLLSPDDIAGILLKSRANNLRRGITGMLLYKGGSVLQVLEGEKTEVDALYAIIERDKRHRGVIRMFEKTIAQRDFPEWTMGFYDLNAEGATYLEGYNAILENDFDMAGFKPSAAQKLIAVFKSGR